MFPQGLDVLVCPTLIQGNRKYTKFGRVTLLCLVSLVFRASVKLLVPEVQFSMFVLGHITRVLKRGVTICFVRLLGLTRFL